MDFPDKCPSCQVDMVGPPIPERAREKYNGRKNFSLWQGVYDYECDQNPAFRCYWCAAQFCKDFKPLQIGADK